jgi:nucleoid-associated protein
LHYSRIYKIANFSASAEPSLDKCSLDKRSLDAALPGSNNDDAHNILFDSLRAAFHTHSRRQFGCFDDALPDAALAASVGEYRSKKIDAENLGQQLARHIQQGLNGSEQSQPWYVWLIVESNNDDEIIYLFLLKHEESHYISEQQAVVVGGTIQPNRLQYAAKISLAEWQSAQSKTYLSFLTLKNQQPLTLAWNSLIGFSETTDRATQTEKLLTELESYGEELPPEQEREYRTRVVDYCLDKDKVGEPVEIKALSRYVNEEAPDALFNFLTDRIEDSAPALYADRKQLKRYTRLYGRDNDLSIGFSTMMLGQNIIYDESTETLTIRAIPKSLKSQLAKYVKKPK